MSTSPAPATTAQTPSVVPLPARPAAPAAPQSAQALAQKRYLNAVSSSPDKETLLEEIGRIVAQSTGPETLNYYSRDESNVLSPQVLVARDNAPAYQAKADPLLPCATEACVQGGAKIILSDHPPRSMLVGIPVHFRNRPPEAIVAIYRADVGRLETLLSGLQLAAVHVTLWQTLQDHRQSELEAQSTAALQELLARLEAAPDPGRACQALVVGLQAHLGCHQVALGMCAPGRPRCRLQAISGVQDMDRHSPLARCLEAAMQETLLRDALTVWPPAGATDRRAALTHHKLCTMSNVPSVISTPLRQADGEAIGVWLFLGEKERLSSPQNQNFIRASQERVAACLSLVRRARRGPVARICTRVLGRSRPSRSPGGSRAGCGGRCGLAGTLPLQDSLRLPIGARSAALRGRSLRRHPGDSVGRAG